ncbi:isopenicillin N synthase family oxygenase [Allofrancisella guangzhouensis]|uniref:2-oxoglutarate-dependent ethylene/succinate-forming enzyme n=1 Tax=Allofrancisella guangzhouensis TaxID=594679 RepID=A0A0A8E4Y0_9GAMM|nr:2OG-Fe(II) oxygenase family protein [Allofrancisella guangzhouensis]AJC48627.1 oxidoreductase [Allofrancisella guangzhouensis]MBK2043703.1 isopenicillin N synthase family oxygenase [Allofrancisella guangzhouensis]MBK2046240.1 isopenicillin N synthase family oxygenase [Allofrancisella guangzhouensis]
MNILSVDYYVDGAAKDFTRSLKETGFAVLKTHPIDWNLVQTVYKEWEDFLKSENVHNYRFDAEKQDGYFPKDVSEVAKGEKIKDIKHFYHLYFPWGRYPSEVSDSAKKMFYQMIELGKTLLQWVDDYMDPRVADKLPMRLRDTISEPGTLLRILHYPAMQGNEEPGAVRAAAHEDINLITLLPIASSPGLQVLSPTNNQWYDVPCDSESIIINIGDMLQEMTNGEYIATKHRVVKPNGEADNVDRISTPCFIHPKADVYLSERYPQAGDFLDERLKELGLK